MADIITQETRVKKRCISQLQIAKALNVNQSTVSFALRGSPNVSNLTKQKVLELCKKYNYRPNYFSRNLRSPCNSVIGLVIPPLHDAYFARLLHFLIARLREFNYDVMIRTVTDRANKKEGILELLDQRVGGVLVMGAVHPEVCGEVQDILGNSIPLVIVGATAEGVSCVSTNKFNGALQAGRHLVSIGRRRLAIMVGHSISITGSDNKIAGFSQACLEANLSAPICLGPTLNQTNSETLLLGYQLGNLLLDNHSDIDGILCASDGYATSMVCACIERGIRVPEDIAIIGFDDTPESRFTAIPLTTVQQPIQEIARIATNMLLSEIKSFPSFVPETTILDCNLIIRKSTNPLWKPEQEQVST